MNEETATKTAEPESDSKETSATDIAAKKGRRLGRPKSVRSLALIKSSTKRAYYECYKDIFKPDVLDRQTKELIAIGVASSTGCQGCLTGHIKKALAIGVSIEAIQEAVGVAFSVNAASVVDNSDVAAAALGLFDDDPAPSDD